MPNIGQISPAMGVQDNKIFYIVLYSEKIWLKIEQNELICS
jgi:hypothetical protein